MKKIVTVALLMSMLFTLFACKTASKTYDVLIDINGLGSDASAIPKEKTFSSLQQTYINGSAEIQRVFEFENQTLNLQYQNSIALSMWDFGKMNVYVEKDKNYQVGFDVLNDRLCRIVANNSKDVLLKYSKPVMSESLYYEWLTPIISRWFSLDLSNYKIESETVLQKNTDSTSSYQSMDGLLVTADDPIQFYTIEYKEIINGCVINLLRIGALPNGDIRFAVLFPSGIEKTAEIEIDDKKLDETILSTLQTTFKNYQISGYQTESKQLRTYEGKYYLLCGVLAIVEEKGGEEPITMRLFLAIDLNISVRT